VFSVTGVRPLIYLNQSTVKKYIWSKIINESFGLWLAVYDYDPNKPCPSTPWPSVAIKQYSNKLSYGSLAVDGDVFYGDINTFKSYGRINNSDPTMTQDQTNILAFLTSQNANEGKVREAFGALNDAPGKDAEIVTLQNEVTAETLKTADVQAQVNKLQGNVTDLNGQINKLKKQIDDMAQTQVPITWNGVLLAIKKLLGGK